jgi:hypothetical protein
MATPRPTKAWYTPLVPVVAVLLVIGGSVSSGAASGGGMRWLVLRCGR